jgi:hypothetical protein
MNSADLTPEQLSQMFTRLAPIAHYLARLKARMIEQQFPPDDELFQMVEKAHAGAHALALKVHELAGGGLPPSENW